MKKAKILVAEDEKAQRDLLEGFLRKEGFSVEAVANGREALKKLEVDFFDSALIDYKMPELDGLQTLREVRKLYPDLPVVMMTAYGTVETAVASMKEGAHDYLTKPIDLDELLLILQKVMERSSLLQENKALKAQLQERYTFTNIVYGSPKMEEVMGLVSRVAPSQATILIRGESGTGKELIANAIHYAGPRSGKPLVKVSCSAIPETLLESELFGHEKGAFTGATQRRIGRFEEADGGTVFLDEIGDLSPSIQVKLLRILQEKEFQRLGSNSNFKTDVRVITATHQHLEEAMKQGHFREDLYYRLNVIKITMPPLRERKKDVPLLVRYYLTKRSSDRKREIHISVETMASLVSHDWPGNIRELFNALEYALAVSNRNSIEIEDLPINISRPKRIELFKEWVNLEEIGREYIAKVFKAQGGNLQKTARILNISRPTLYKKLRKYRITG